MYNVAYVIETNCYGNLLLLSKVKREQTKKKKKLLQFQSVRRKKSTTTTTTTQVYEQPHAHSTTDRPTDWLLWLWRRRRSGQKRKTFARFIIDLYYFIITIIIRFIKATEKGRVCACARAPSSTAYETKRAPARERRFAVAVAAHVFLAHRSAAAAAASVFLAFARRARTSLLIIIAFPSTILPCHQWAASPYVQSGRISVNR